MPMASSRPLIERDMDSSSSDSPPLSSIEHAARQKQKLEVLETDIEKIKMEIEKLKANEALNSLRIKIKQKFDETTLETVIDQLAELLNRHKNYEKVEKEAVIRFMTVQYNANSSIESSSGVAPTLNRRNNYPPLIIKAKL